MSNFKEIFKKLRLDAQLTQEQLAANLELSRSAISMYERGEREPDFETLEVIADFFNVDMNYLTGWLDDPINRDDGNLVASTPTANENAQKELVADTAAEAAVLSKPSIRNIARAASENKLTDENLELLERYAKMMWPEAFEDK